MLIGRRRGWELRESEATPESVFYGRRELLKAVAAGSILAPGLLSSLAAAAGEVPEAGLYPAKQNPRYTLDRPLTDEKLATSYNNFYEFGSQKSIADGAQALVTHPWAIKIDGLVDKPMTVDFDDLVKKMPLEERLYRHRCVEAWSMAVPWSGIPMAAFVDFAKPLGSAKYVQMETFLDAKTAPGQK
jgi:sulfoxide reductase catalytic subunit YedY